MGTSTSTYEFIVRLNVVTYTSHLFKFLRFIYYLAKNYLFVVQVRPPVNYLLSTYLFEPPLFKTELQTKNHTLSRFLSAKLLHSNLIFVGLGSNHFEGNYHILLRAEN